MGDQETTTRLAAPATAETPAGAGGGVQPQVSNENAPMRVDQVDEALYMPVNQYMQPPSGSTHIAA